MLTSYFDVALNKRNAGQGSVFCVWLFSCKDSMCLTVRKRFLRLRADFTSKLIRELAFGTPKFYIAPYDKINHGLVNMSSNYDDKSGLNFIYRLQSNVCRVPKCPTALNVRQILLFSKSVILGT